MHRCNGAGEVLAAATIYFMSDSYIGLDQQYTLQILPPSAANASGKSPATGWEHQQLPFTPDESSAASVASSIEGRRARRAAAASSRKASVPTEELDGSWGASLNGVQEGELNDEPCG
jgi:hypothetical protein